MKKTTDSSLPALFIGRFQPFHLGHLDAVKQILRMHKKIIIGIGSSQYSGQSKNPFSAALRKKMITVSLRTALIPRKKFAIVPIPDIHNDAAWVTHVEKLSPRFGTVWSGTPKVQKLFKKDGRHTVKAPKMNKKISGTLVRRFIKSGGNWKKFLPLSVAIIINDLSLDISH